MQYVGNIGPKIDIQLYNLKLNNRKLSEEILTSQSPRLSTDPVSSNFEDSKFNILPNSESETFQYTITQILQEENLKLNEVWSHIHKPLESTNTHFHSSYSPFDFSFVYYVKVPTNSGVFVIDFTLISGFRKPIFPIEGNLLIFPSWLPHMVTKNLSNDTRISISGNISK